MSAAVGRRDRTRSRQLMVLAAGVVVVAASVLLSLALGARQIDLAAVLEALVAPVSGDNDHMVVRELRVPRTILGVLAGAALGLAGALMQGLTRNPLADP